MTQLVFRRYSCRWLCAGVLGLVLGAGCAPNPVDVELVFPREQNFLFTDFARLLVYEVDPVTGLGDCPALLERINAGNFGEPALDSGSVAICNFRDGSVSFGDVPPGPHAYVVLAQDDTNAVLLTGCTLAEAYEDAPAVSVPLYPTLGYEEATAGRTLTCGNAEQKCSGGCR